MAEHLFEDTVRPKLMSFNFSGVVVSDEYSLYMHLRFSKAINISSFTLGNIILASAKNFSVSTNMSMIALTGGLISSHINIYGRE